MTKEFETARSGKTESIKEVLTRIQHARARNSYVLMIEDRDWLVVLQCMQDHHLFKSNPKRPPLSAFHDWLEKEGIEQYFARCIVREMSDANKLINGARYPWDDAHMEPGVLKRWRGLYQALDRRLSLIE